MDATPTPERSAGRAVIPVTGEVDLATAPALRRLIHDALEDPAVHTLVVDLDGATFIDCAGVSTLLGGRAEASRCRKTYAVVNPNGVAERVLTLTGAWPTLQPARLGSRAGRTSASDTAHGRSRLTGLGGRGKPREQHHHAGRVPRTWQPDERA